MMKSAESRLPAVAGRSSPVPAPGDRSHGYSGAPPSVVAPAFVVPAALIFEREMFRDMRRTRMDAEELCSQTDESSARKYEIIIVYLDGNELLSRDARKLHGGLLMNSDVPLSESAHALMNNK